MQHFLKLWDLAEETVAIIIFCILILLGVCQVISRFGVFDFPLDWTEELSRYAFIMLVYVAASLGIAKKRHVRVEVIDLILPVPARKWLNLVVNIGWAAFNLIIAHAGWVVAEEAMTTTTPVLQWNMGWLYMIIPVTFVLMSLRLVFRIIEDWSPQQGGC